MFDDQRGKKILLVAHCILNQNAKIDHCAHYPGTIKELAQLLINSEVGLLQMPCPELRCLGLDRQVVQRAGLTIESEDTRVALRMNEEPARALCHAMINDLIYQISEYQKNAFKIVGIVGINGSPTCGVETTWSNDLEEKRPGIFIQMLDEECRKRGIVLSIKGIKAFEIQQAVTTAKDLLENVRY